MEGLDDDHEEQFQSTALFDPDYSSIHITNTQTPALSSNSSKRKRNLPGNPDPDAEVVALSPRSLMATNRYICEVCHKGFQRDQNLQLHRRGHNLPWKLKQRASNETKKRVYVCPEPSCVHHKASRALGDLTGIKKHYCRKHGEKKWKCDKCSKRYAVHSDWKAHTKICGTREYRCDCSTIFSRKDSFVTHRAFCDALSDQDKYKGNMESNQLMNLSAPEDHAFNHALSFNSNNFMMISTNLDPSNSQSTTSSLALGSAYTSATALLQKAAEMGSKSSDNSITPTLFTGFTGFFSANRFASDKIHETSSSADFNAVSMPTGTHAARNMEAAEVPEMGLYHLSALMNPSTSVQNRSGLSEREHDEKMTLDFLGVEPSF